MSNTNSASQQLELRIESAIREAGPTGLHRQQLEAMREPAEAINAAVNRLVTTRRVELRQANGQVTLYIPTNSGGLSEGCAFVLEEIKASGGEGIDLQSIISRTKMQRVEVNKAIKILADKKLIDETRSFTNKAMKVYIQAGVALSKTVTGGVFYTGDGRERKIDSPFVDSVRGEIMNFIHHHKVVSNAQVKHHFDAKSLPKSLAQRDIDVLINTLQLDGFVERVSPMDADNAAAALKVAFPPRSLGGDLFFKIADNVNHSILKASTLDNVATIATQMPCMGCPLLHQCSSSGLGPVNPSKCVYLNDWLLLEKEEKA